MTDKNSTPNNKPVTHDEMVQYIRKNLSIKVDICHGEIDVELQLEDKPITSCSASLPAYECRCD